MQPSSPTPRLKFTHPSIKRISAPQSGFEIYADSETAGLFLRVSRGRTDEPVKSFYVRRRVHGHIRQSTIGSFPAMGVGEARTAAAKVIMAMGEGKAPSDERRKARAEAAKATRKDPTIKSVWEDVKESILSKTASEETIANYEYAFIHLDKAFPDRKLSGITFAEIRSLHKRIGKKTPITANRTVELLERLFKVAAARYGYAGEKFRTIAATGSRKIRWDSVGGNTIILHRSTPRDRKMSADEDERFRKTLDRMRGDAMVPDPELSAGENRRRAERGTVALDFILTAYTVGVRKSAALRMRWEDIEWQKGGGGLWRIAASVKGAKGREQVAYLPPDLARILHHRRTLVGKTCPWVFPGGERAKCPHLQEPKRQWKNLLTAAKIEGLTMHDMRRGLADRIRRSGGTDREISAALGHAPNSRITGTIYDTIAPDRVGEIMRLANAGSTFPAPPDPSDPAVIGRIGAA